MLEQAFRLDGQIALVTGGASGIGKATSLRLAEAGATVVAADIDLSGVQATSAEIVDRGGTARAIQVDVSRREEVEAAVSLAVAEFSTLDIMCNIAGIGDEGPLIEVTEERFDRLNAVNVKGTLFGCQAAARVMIPSGRGHIINVATTGIDVPELHVGAYSVTKAAVAMLSMTLASQLAPSGIRVNVVAPGATVTAFSTRNLYDADGVLDQRGFDAYVEKMRGYSPLGLVGQADDQALLILYLVSPAGRLATGNIFRVNAGFSMAW